MEAEARYTWVGAGVLLLLAALVGAVLWLKNVGRAEDFKFFVIRFEQQALDGLEVGADVSLRGLKVGRLQDYALAGNKINRVRVVIRLDRRTPVHANTVAVITRNFVTGIAAITLITREPAGDPLTKAPDDEPYPVIAEGHSELDEITGRVNRIGEMAALALGNVNELLNAENRQAVAATVRNVRDLSAALNQRIQALDDTMRRVGLAATQLGQAAAQFGTSASSLVHSGERLATVAEQGGRQLEPTLAEVERTLTDARQSLKTIAAAAEAMQRQAVASARQLEHTAISVDDQLGAALADLRLTLDTAARLMDRLREPRSALLGAPPGLLGPGEKQP